MMPKHWAVRLPEYLHPHDSGLNFKYFSLFPSDIIFNKTRVQQQYQPCYTCLAAVSVQTAVCVLYTYNLFVFVLKRSYSICCKTFKKTVLTDCILHFSIDMHPNTANIKARREVGLKAPVASKMTLHLKRCTDVAIKLVAETYIATQLPGSHRTQSSVQSWLFFREGFQCSRNRKGV